MIDRRCFDCGLAIQPEAVGHMVMPAVRGSQGPQERCNSCETSRLRTVAARGLPRSLAEIGVPELLRAASLDDLAAPVRQALETSTGDVLLHGPTGTGKSHAAAGFVAWLVAYSLVPASEIRWIGVAEAVDELTTFNSSAAALRELVGLRVLILDDIGLERDSPFVRERLDALLVTRYDRQRRTIATTNLVPSEILKRSARVGSRLLSATVIRLGGGDRRLSRRAGGGP